MRLPWYLGLATLMLTSSLALAQTTRDQKLLATADQVAAKVAKLRGLKIKRPIKRGVMNKAQLKARLLKRVEQEYSPAELAAEELLLKRFALLEENKNYLNLVIELLTDQIAGFYDPWEKHLYIASFQMIGGEPLMAHEIVHALQDQHFGLRRFMGKSKHNNDATVAKQALVEGDGMAVMIEFLLDGLGQPAPWGNDQMLNMMSSQMKGASGFGSFDKAPLFLKEGLLFPYLSGLKFVGHFRRKHSWRRIDRIYRKPPLSTEHILHPEAYERYERPDRIDAKSLVSLAGTELIHHDVNGELGMKIWLRQHGVSENRAGLASMGWGGDRIAILGPRAGKGLDRVVGVSSSSWDSEADAIEFYEAAVDALSSFAGTPVPNLKGVDFVGKKFRSTIERRGDQVVFLIGVDRSQAAPTVAEVFSRWTVRRR